MQVQIKAASGTLAISLVVQHRLSGQQSRLDGPFCYRVCDRSTCAGFELFAALSGRTRGNPPFSLPLALVRRGRFFCFCPRVTSIRKLVRHSE